MENSQSKPKSPLMLQARQKIRDAIILGKIEPGAHLKEARLSGELGISRLPIREALRLLEKEGLVENLPYKGTFVKRLTQKDAVDVFTVRGAIEELGIKLMMPRVTPAIVDGLKQAIARVETAEKGGDLIACADEDLGFHRLLCEYADNDRLLAVWDNLALQAKIFLCMGKSGYGADKDYAKSHASLLRAIEMQNTELAVSHLRIHIAEGLDYLLKYSCHTLAKE